MKKISANQIDLKGLGKALTEDKWREDFVKTKRDVMKKNRLRGCQFDPKKAPPPIKFVPSDEHAPPSDPTDEIIEQLKSMGCPIAMEQFRKCESPNGEQTTEALDFVGKETTECECAADSELKSDTVSVQTTAIMSADFVASLAFSIAKLLKDK